MLFNSIQEASLGVAKQKVIEPRPKQARGTLEVTNRFVHLVTRQAHMKSSHKFGGDTRLLLPTEDLASQVYLLLGRYL